MATERSEGRFSVFAMPLPRLGQKVDAKRGAIVGREHDVDRSAPLWGSRISVLPSPDTLGLAVCISGKWQQ